MAKSPVGVPPGAAAEFDTPIRNGNGHPATAIQTLLHNLSRDEIMQRLSPQRKALYERIQALQKAIGASPIEIAESLRELREHA